LYTVRFAIMVSSLVAGFSGVKLKCSERAAERHRQDAQA
jgi:hypothetical protein